MKTTQISNLNACALVCAMAFAATIAQAADLVGTVQCAGKPIGEATVTLYAAGAETPTQLAQGKTNDVGAFTLTYGDAPADSILYVIAKGGTPNKKTGVVSMIRPDGTQPAPEGFTGGGNMNAGWGIVVDGNDDVWAASGLGRGIVLLAGAGPNGHPPGTKPGDFIHFFQSGTTEVPTIGSIDPAGNLWVANNWDSVEAATSADPFRPTSTQGGGSGFTVFYGVAAPVKTPLIGTVRQP